MNFNVDQELSLINELDSDSFSTEDQIEDGVHINIQSDDIISLPNLKPILCTTPSNQDPNTKKKTIRWVDELVDDPRPLHEERSTPRWIKSQRASFFHITCFQDMDRIIY